MCMWGLHNLRVLPGSENPGVPSRNLADATVDPVLWGKPSGLWFVRHSQASSGARMLKGSMTGSTGDRVLPAELRDHSAGAPDIALIGSSSWPGLQAPRTDGLQTGLQDLYFVLVQAVQSAWKDLFCQSPPLSEFHHYHQRQDGQD